ncbi:MAG TPA: acyltransferase domain-containing protein, partial [Candidatus Saccharimonadales bacterium]|nr:acyltransferase domain-containing protein [Candidatus Saccharimonadales bacterium]
MVAGQGTAEAGMGADAYDNSPRARRVFEVGTKITRINLMEVCFGDQTGELSKTEIAQPALTAADMADYLYMEELGFKPDAGEGHSMGEIPLLGMAGVISIEGMFKLIKVRGEASAKLRPGMMARVQNMSIEQIEHELGHLFTSGRLAVTNFNSLLQHMLSGDEDLIMAARDIVKNRAKQVAELKNAKISR